jgi:hypothetical protein
MTLAFGAFVLRALALLVIVGLAGSATLAVALDDDFASEVVVAELPEASDTAESDPEGIVAASGPAVPDRTPQPIATTRTATLATLSIAPTVPPPRR